MNAHLRRAALSALIATALFACGDGDTPPPTSYATAISAKTAALTLQCECLTSQGEYVSEDACLTERDPQPAEGWLSCADAVIASGGHSAAISCYASGLESAKSCIQDEPCNTLTYPLSVQACLSESQNGCVGLDAAIAAISAECDANGSPGGGDGGTSPGSLRMGELCLDDADCISGECLESEFGAPFCTRSCDEPKVECPAGEDAGPGEALCVSFAAEWLPFPELIDDFQGEMDTFCVPRCTSLSACREHNESWETCDKPKYKGDIVYPSLGNGGNICQAPSHHGKDPVNPSECNYEKTIGNFGGEASLCGFYCDFLETCLFVDRDVYPAGCCEWGCFSRMVPEGDEVDDAWHDEVKCFIDDHNAWPAVGVDNSCNHPPKACGGAPEDPTHPAAVPL